MSRRLPYAGEGGFALWHFSEDPALSRFRPRAPLANPGGTPLVRAVDTRHAPMSWFPRDCQRGCIWVVATTTVEDRERFFGQGDATRIHVIEAGWVARMQACRVYAYRLPAAGFRPHEVGGYWVSDEQVDAVEQVVVGDLILRHAAAGIDLRITASGRSGGASWTRPSNSAAAAWLRDHDLPRADFRWQSKLRSGLPRVPRPRRAGH